MVASISMAGSMSVKDNWPSSNTILIRLSKTLVIKNMLSQVRPKTANARQLAQQAMKLKNMLLASGCACQCISAGACQNKEDKGRYNNMENKAAV